MATAEVVNTKTLNQLYRELCNAYENGDRELTVRTINKIGCALPGIPNQALEVTRQIFMSHGQIMVETQISLVSDEELKWNVQGYLIAMERCLREEESTFFSIEAFGKLFDVVGKFEPEQKLYEKGKKVLTVAGLLSAVEYGLRAFNVFGPEKATIYTREVAPALREIKAVLMNENDVKKPLNRQLHAMVDYMRNAVKPHLEKESHKRVEEGVSTAVDLAIDFFCWR